MGKERERERERGKERERMGERNRKHAVSGVGDFIKNSCVWKLLSEPSLPDQGLCCQPSSGSTMLEREKERWTRTVRECGGFR